MCSSDLVYISKTARRHLFLLQKFDKQDEMQLSAKLKKIQCMGFRAIFLGVILLAMNKPRPSIEMTVDQLAEAKEASQI